MAKGKKTPRISTEPDSTSFGLSLGVLFGREDTPIDSTQPRDDQNTLSPPNGSESQPGRVILTRETKGRGGKTVTSVTFREGIPSNMEETAKQLRSALGCGGTAESERILLQGNQTDRAALWFASKGYNVVKGN